MSSPLSPLQEARAAAKRIPDDEVHGSSNAEATMAFALLHIAECMERLIRATQQRLP